MKYKTIETNGISALSRRDIIAVAVETLRTSGWHSQLALAVFLVSVSFYNYLLFHILAEGFAIAIGVLMCVVAWQTHAFTRNYFLMYLANGYFWIAMLDLVHTLVYKGMNIYPITEANPSVQFWIATRYFEALLLLSAPLLLTRTVSKRGSFLAFGLLAAIVYALVMSGNFPDGFIEGQGLTPFKVNSEYIISMILVTALLHIWHRRYLIGSETLALMSMAVLFTICGELAFTFYVNVYGFSNLVGHIFKLFSFWLIFIAIIRTNLIKPYTLLHDEVIKRRETEEALRNSNKKLQELDQMKSMLIASMSHELRTPLNAIIGFTTLILTGMVGKIEEKQKDYLGRINEAAKHLLNMIVDVIDISKIEAGHIETVTEQFALNTLVDEVAKMVEESIKKKNLSLQIELDHAIELYSDRRRVEQSVLNYLSNAVKYTENGLITVGAYEEKEYVVITVSDTGIGFDDDDKSRLFKPFERLDSHLKVQEGGAGIGLYMTKKIVEELLGGEVFVSSTPGVGSTFGLKIPKVLAEKMS